MDNGDDYLRTGSGRDTLRFVDGDIADLTEDCTSNINDLESLIDFMGIVVENAVSVITGDPILSRKNLIVVKAMTRTVSTTAGAIQPRGLMTDDDLKKASSAVEKLRDAVEVFAKPGGALDKKRAAVSDASIEVRSEIKNLKVNWAVELTSCLIDDPEFGSIFTMSKLRGR